MRDLVLVYAENVFIIYGIKQIIIITVNQFAFDSPNLGTSDHRQYHRKYAAAVPSIVDSYELRFEDS